MRIGLSPPSFWNDYRLPQTPEKERKRAERIEASAGAKYVGIACLYLGIFMYLCQLKCETNYWLPIKAFGPIAPLFRKTLFVIRNTTRDIISPTRDIIFLTRHIIFPTSQILLREKPQGKDCRAKGVSMSLLPQTEYVTPSYRSPSTPSIVLIGPNKKQPLWLLKSRK